MARRKVLVIEDEKDILELISYNLKREGYDALTAVTGEEGLSKAITHRPDLILLDLMLPGLDGLEVCRRLKQEPSTRDIPIVMVTAKGEESDIVAGLELGAEDYITKPFSPRVLMARVRVIMRRLDQGRPDVGDIPISVHGIEIDPSRHSVKVEGAPVTLTYTEFKILQLLASRPGVVFSRSAIVHFVHGEDYPVTERSVDVHITSLRRKLGEGGKLIETVRGVGYRMREA